MKFHSITPKIPIRSAIRCYITSQNHIGKIPNTREKTEKPKKILLSYLKTYRIHPIIVSGLPLADVVISIIDRLDLWSKGHHAFSGRLGVRGLPAWKGDFLVPSPSQAYFIVWDWAEPTQYHLLLEAHLKYAFMELKIHAIRLRIPFRSILSPLVFSFVFRFLHRKTLMHRIFLLPDFKFYELCLWNPSGVAIVDHRFNIGRSFLSWSDGWDCSLRSLLHIGFGMTEGFCPSSMLIRWSDHRCIAWSQSPGLGSWYCIYVCLRSDIFYWWIGVSSTSA